MERIKHSVQLVLEKFVCLLVTRECGNQQDARRDGAFNSEYGFLVK